MPVYQYTNTKGKTLYYVSVSYVDWQNKRKRHIKRGFALAREAKAYEVNFLANIAKDCSMSFESLASRYLENIKKRKIAETTYRNRLAMINAHFLPTFSAMPINSITAATIEAWQNSIIDKNFAPTYLYKLNKTLSLVFKYAVKYHGLAENPVELIDNIGRSKQEKIIFWTISDFNTFLDVLQANKFRIQVETIKNAYIAAFKTLFYTGLRIGELLALTIGDYDPKAAAITVSKSYDWQSKKLGPTKNRKTRVISIPAQLCTVLDNYLVQLYDTSDRNYNLFPQLTYTKIDNLLKNVIKLASLPAISIHDLRHAHASLLVSLNINPLAICKRLGHATVQITLDRYAHLYPHESKYVATEIEKIIESSNSVSKVYQ